MKFEPDAESDGAATLSEADEELEECLLAGLAEALDLGWLLGALHGHHELIVESSVQEE